MALSNELEQLKAEMLEDASSSGEKACVLMMFECLTQGLKGKADMAKMSTEARGWLKANLSVRTADTDEKINELWEAKQAEREATSAFRDLKLAK